ncbi:Radical SAM domain protein [Desulfitobacterium hafniense DCB-2]|uniref:Radical SAM domain protein n=1 Tax=Desulfitobacterium hafniense (strain DSM 10664 / DCB-2) TaxID=272564 RepID=B8FS89_DESHD|nr:arsenosugar biosynthesis radical SAM (seleno)protein ArsS [Desulfitobacterium hafniense]ACL21877.1 Radical SAM domain protein [Desulfitobacterium hafniense DCB-2]
MGDARLERLDGIPAFETKFGDQALMDTAERLSVLQINVGKRCNLACKHCHVEAGPNRTEEMSREVMEACLRLLEENPFATVDITGGAPELNPHFRWLVGECAKGCAHVIVRTNLVILLEEGYTDLPEFYRDHRVNVVCSLPHYTAKNTDRMRGEQVFRRSIEAMKRLNEVGYGQEPELVLDLVYNPGGAFLPPSQTAMEAEYKEHLLREYGVSFSHLFTITNNPIGRFGAFLERSGNLEDYMYRLYGAFNASTLESMMCRFQVSVGWDGRLYNCDFNQAADLPMADGATIFDWTGKPMAKQRIRFGKHCYACTAGQGSSCGGATEGV